MHISRHCAHFSYWIDYNTHALYNKCAYLGTKHKFTQNSTGAIFFSSPSAACQTLRTLFWEPRICLWALSKSISYTPWDSYYKYNPSFFRLLWITSLKLLHISFPPNTSIFSSSWLHFLPPQKRLSFHTWFSRYSHPNNLFNVFLSFSSSSSKQCHLGKNSFIITNVPTITNKLYYITPKFAIVIFTQY